MRVALCFILFGLSLGLACAQKNVRTYHDPMQRQVHEDYFVSVADGTTLEGPYKRYFPNGKLEISGTFEDGRRSGIFYEYNSRGVLVRKIAYLNGTRHGAVEVYNDKGVVIQRALTRTAC